MAKRESIIYIICLPLLEYKMIWSYLWHGAKDDHEEMLINNNNNDHIKWWWWCTYDLSIHKPHTCINYTRMQNSCWTTHGIMGLTQPTLISFKITSTIMTNICVRITMLSVILQYLCNIFYSSLNKWWPTQLIAHVGSTYG